MPYCHSCGQRVDASHRFCQHCGAEVDSGRRRSERDGTREPGSVPVGDDRREQQTGGYGQEDAGRADAGPPQDRKDGVEFALTYPVSNGWGATLVSGVLLLTGFLLVPFLALAGYSYRVGRAAALGREEPPGYGNWGGLIVDGLRFTVVGLVLAVGFGLLWALVFVLIETSPWFALLVVPMYLVAIYALPAFVAAFLGTGSVTRAFTGGEAATLLGSGYYAKSVLFWLLLQFALGFVVALLFLTLVGWIWGYAFTFLAGSAFWGYVYYRAAGQGIVPSAAGTVGRDSQAEGNARESGAR